MEISTISSDGQVLIPKIIRDYLQLHSGHRITYAIEPNGQVTLRPVSRGIDPSALGGEMSGVWDPRSRKLRFLRYSKLLALPALRSRAELVNK